MEEEGKDNELHYKAEEGDEEVNEMRNKEEKEKGDNFAFYIQNKKMKKTVKKKNRKKERIQKKNSNKLNRGCFYQKVPGN